MIEFVAAGTVLGLSVGFSQEVAKQLLRSLRRRRRPTSLARFTSPRLGTPWDDPTDPPPPLSGPPQPLTADLIRYARWRDQPILNPGRVQRGDGSGGPTLPKFPSPRVIPGDTP